MWHSILNSLNIKIYDHITNFAYKFKRSVAGTHLGRHLKELRALRGYLGPQ